ncbi:MAG: Com family DNA-binding transcriptional regulator [Clostridia bacterium]|nr:Com family DNA-binding transcriptional regulator [Clostridia bacterium]
MIKVKCKNCGRILCEVEGKLRIKCRRCGELNYIKTDIADQASQG